MIKWPEPLYNNRHRAFEDSYSEAQLKQAVRDALEEAANLCCNDHDCGAIRALIKEIA